MNHPKFRVWDKAMDMMFDLVLIRYDWRDEISQLIISDRKSSRLLGSSHAMSVEYSNIDFSRFKLEQYTGLKDKNGVDAYEGDILSTTVLTKGLVVFRNGCFGLKSHDNVFFNFDQLRMYRRKFEVIGNIHENPKPLKEKKN